MKKLLTIVAMAIVGMAAFAENFEVIKSYSKIGNTELFINQLGYETLKDEKIKAGPDSNLVVPINGTLVFKGDEGHTVVASGYQGKVIYLHAVKEFNKEKTND